VKVLFMCSAALEILMLLGLFLAGRRHVLSALRRPYAGPQRLKREPKLAMIVPITGDSPEGRAGLQTLLKQDYPNLRVVLVTRDESDPATAMARELVRSRQDARHVLSGPALRCGQKNHNLLAGIAAIGDWPEAYVFCDASHLARPDLARLLVEPLAEGKALISGGFHRIVPLDNGVGTLGMLLTCLALHCMQAIRAITQPWGGAMAITRQAFEEHGIAKVWAENIVDDFSMGPHLAKRGIRTWRVGRACLETPLRDVKLSNWETWLVRQLLYLKFCTPEIWLGALGAAWLFGFPPVAAVAGIVGGLTGMADPWWIGAGFVYLMGFLPMGLLFRTLSPRPVPLLPWFEGFATTMVMTFWCYARTWTTFTMSWRGIAYRVTWGGRVLRIIRQ